MANNHPPILYNSFAAAQVEALMRGWLVAFLPLVYKLLHPGKPPLVMDWYLLAMCQAFQKTAIGDIRRLVVNVPPRHLKSITSTAFTAWMLGHSPSHKFMFVTYGDKLGRDHLEWLEKIMTSPFYRRLFPEVRLLSGGIGRGVLRTTAGGGSRVVTVGGATTGFGADIILIDDAMKAEDITSEARRAELDLFYRGTLLTRLDSKQRGTLISIQQRLGPDDLPARLIEAGAEHLCLPSYDGQEQIYDIGFGRRYRRPPGEVLRPIDEPMEVLEQYRRDMGPHQFATQCLQQPSALEGNVIRLDRLGRYNPEDLPDEPWEMIVQSWDTASSEEPRAAYSVCLTFGLRKRRWYLVDALRQRLSYPALRDRVLALRRLWNAEHVLIENASSGAHLLGDLKRLGPRPIMIRPEGDKVTRMVGQLALIEDGDLLVPTQAPWLDTFLAELRAFPVCQYMDQIDALSQFLEWTKRKEHWLNIPRDPVTGRKLYVNRPDKPRRR